MAERFSGLPDHMFLRNEAAREVYDLAYRDTLFASGLHASLARTAIAEIVMPIPSSDFESVIAAYETCLVEAPHELALTSHRTDHRFGNDAGQMRKNPDTNGSGQQTQDGKNLFHFNETAWLHWADLLRTPSDAFKDFMHTGFDLHNELLGVARAQFDELEETHPNISAAFFPDKQRSHTFMRVLSYDTPDDTSALRVGKWHYDISGATIQAYADDVGFCGQNPGGETQSYPSKEGTAHMFMGKGYHKLYEGTGTPIKALYHGIERPEQPTRVKRHAVVLFVNAPLIDFDVTKQDTLPEIDSAA